jgi:hypothetical protein
MSIVSIFAGLLVLAAAPSCNADVQSDLVNCAAQLTARGIVPAWEQASLASAQRFALYADYDRQHVNRTAMSIAAFRGHTSIQPSDWRDAVQQPIDEVDALQAALGRALTACQAVRAGGGRPAAVPRPANLRVDPSLGLYVDAAGRPYIPGGYNQLALPNNTSDWNAAKALAMDVTEGFVQPNSFLPAPNAPSAWVIAELNTTAAAAVQHNLSQFTVFLGNGRPSSHGDAGNQAMPTWALAEDPDLAYGAGHTSFFSYDIDHPLALDVWNQTLAAVVPVVLAHFPGGRGLSFSLANEPGFYTANSTYTLAGFVQFLKTRYNGSTAAVSAAWRLPSSKPLSGFDDPRIAQAMTYDDTVAAQLLDWNVYNNARVTRWFSALRGLIYSHAQMSSLASIQPPALGVYLKASNGRNPLGSAPVSGIDRVALGAIMDVHGCDTRSGPDPTPHFSAPVGDMWPASLYAIDWGSIAGSYDFMRSMDRRKPIVDTEWHGISTVNYRQANMSRAYLRAALWISHGHGLALTEVWYWGRTGWTATSALPKEFGGADFAFSLMTQAQLLDEYARNQVTINAVAPDMAQLLQAAPQVGLLFSEASRVADPPHMAAQYAAYGLAHSLGVPLAFVPDQWLVDGPPAGASIPSVLLVAAVSYISDAAVAALASRPMNTTIILANATLHDRLLGFDDRGKPRSSAARTFLSHLPYVDMGATAGPQAFGELEQAAAPHLSRELRCVDANAGAGSSASGQISPVFGVLCRTSVSSTSGTMSGTTLLVNLRNATLAIALELSNSTRLQEAVDLETTQQVTLPLSMAPLEVKLLRWGTV